MAVPTHLYKVIVIDTGDKERPQALGAFVVPNKPISSEKMLKEFQVRIHYINIYIAPIKLSALQYAQYTVNA